MNKVGLWRKRLRDVHRMLLSDRKLLLAGKIAELTAQDAKRLEIEGRLAGLPRDAVEAEQGLLADIQRLAQRNNRLLAAYLEGARLAMQRLKEIEKMRGRIGAYQRDGSRIDPPTPPTTRQVRA